MYKLFLCLRYLRKRVMAYFAMIAVAMCVFMVLIAISTMDGFVHKIEVAAKGLFGDIVVDSGSAGGIGYYDEFAAEVKRQVPQVEAASPFILVPGVLSLPGSTFQQGVMVAGIRLPERAQVAAFAKGLHFESGATPSFDPPLSLLVAGLKKEVAATEKAAADLDRQGRGRTADTLRLWGLVQSALVEQRAALDKLSYPQAIPDALAELGRQIQQAKDADDQERLSELQRKRRELSRELIQGASQRAILGLGLPSLSFRTPEGKVIRRVLPGDNITLTLLPLGRRLSMADITPVERTFTVVDDCRTDVSSIDSNIVYVPFETLQLLANLGPVEGAEPGQTGAVPRCSQIHFKVRNPNADERELELIAAKMRDVWAQFERQRPAAVDYGLTIQTWRQRQAQLVGQIESQRTLVVIMFGIISSTAVVLIFVLFYTIVVQKTRDIGVIKSLGGSSLGVAGIFLGYGAAVGMLGALAGGIGGVIFVRNINPIHDWVGRVFGFQVWNREWFMFDQIPSEVQPATVVAIALGAVVAGLVGALLPAIKAARMQPVEALRYE